MKDMSPWLTTLVVLATLLTGTSGMSVPTQIASPFTGTDSSGAAPNSSTSGQTPVAYSEDTTLGMKKQKLVVKNKEDKRIVVQPVGASRSSSSDCSSIAASRDHTEVIAVSMVEGVHYTDTGQGDTPEMRRGQDLERCQVDVCSPLNKTTTTHEIRSVTCPADMLMSPKADKTEECSPSHCDCTDKTFEEIMAATWPTAGSPELDTDMTATPPTGGFALKS